MRTPNAVIVLYCLKARRENKSYWNKPKVATPWLTIHPAKWLKQKSPLLAWPLPDLGWQSGDLVRGAAHMISALVSLRGRSCHRLCCVSGIAHKPNGVRPISLSLIAVLTLSSRLPRWGEPPPSFLQHGSGQMLNSE